MRRRNLILGLLLILVVVAIVYGVNKARNTPRVTSPTPTSGAVQAIEETFNLTIPADAEKAELNKVGDSEGVGLATRKFQNGKFEVTVLASLPDPESEKPYQAWLENEVGEKIILGNLRLAKGGYLLDFESNTDLSNYKKVVVSAGGNILEGSF